MRKYVCIFFLSVIYVSFWGHSTSLLWVNNWYNMSDGMCFLLSSILYKYENICYLGLLWQSLFQSERGDAASANKTRRDSVLSRTSVFICILRVCKVIEPEHWEKMKRMTETDEETVKHASGSKKYNSALKSLYKVGLYLGT